MKHKPSDVLLRTLSPSERESLAAQYSHADLYRLRAVQILSTRYRDNLKALQNMTFDFPAYSEAMASLSARLRTYDEILRDIFNHDVLSTGESE